MSDQQVTQLKKLAREAEAEVIEYPDGRVLVVGALINVHWWPASKHRTAYVDGAPRGRKYATAKNVINLATKGMP
jgi:hypothetical protein